MDTAARLLSVITLADSVAGLYDTSIPSVVLGPFGVVPMMLPALVKMYPDGGDEYTVQVRMCMPCTRGEASMVLVSAVENDSWEHIVVHRASALFAVVVEHLQDDDEDSALSE